jgi:HEPN domain-containing protein
MAYAYLSTGREKVMSEDAEKALRMALKAVLIAARKQGLDLENLSNAAADELLQYRTYDSLHVPMAINEIEVAVDALV